jgi:serine/threonine protein kinase
VSDILDHMSPASVAGRRGDLDRFGSYTVLEKLATGGMAELYKVRAPDGGIYALKCIRSDCDDDPEFRKMLRDEAKITHTLNHRNVNRVVKVVEDVGQIGLILEFVDGVDAAGLRRHLKSKSRQLSYSLVVHMVREVLQGLDYVHNAKDENGEYLNIVHRDVSPGNVMVDTSGCVKLVDFGIARAQNRLAKTEVGNVKGKFRYMSPEQIRGDVVGPGADVYATAIFLWELLAGRRIYDEISVAQLMIRVSNAHAPSLEEAQAGLPAALHKVYARATALRPEDRYLSAQAFAHGLDSALLEYDPEACRQEFSELVTTACRKDSLDRFDQAVARARVAAERDLENAILSALEQPDRVERVDVREVKRAESARGPGPGLADAADEPGEPPTLPMAKSVGPDSVEFRGA